MSVPEISELAFERHIEFEMRGKGGWITGVDHFVPELGLDTGWLLRFVQETQPKQWGRLVELYGDDSSTVERRFVQRVAVEIDGRGVLALLRNGVADRGIRFALCYFRPGHTLAAGALDEYRANLLTVARQVRFSARNEQESVDLALFVNGLPVATIELKNPNTGQDAEDAIEQYRRRDPNEVFFAKRTFVHFAVDPDRAFVATRLQGRDTEFLPFNLGTHGPGVSGGGGNPPAKPDSYAVAYLWKQIWQRDNWLEILQRFTHVVLPVKRGTKVNAHTLSRIFPRIHQWDAVQKIVADVYEKGAGANYLVQHSTGSGKSNTIAWLAHRLSNLFNADNEPIFHKTIIVSDRRVLNQQLQRTVGQFEHTPGVVKKIEVNSAQLAESLDDATSKIIISTLQMYPYVLDKIADMGLAGRRYAVIIDEAHSSQGSDTAVNIKKALGTHAQREEDEDEATYLTRVRGRQPNLSYFAFTATPKSPTLKLFGTEDPARIDPRTGKRGMRVPFHVYSMRQAIEEGYILDVLANYLTYDMKWRLRNAAVEAAEKARIANPDVDERKAKAALVRFAKLHPTSVEQRAKLIVDDFQDNIASRLDGRAKAMVVTSGREEAIDLYQAIREYVQLRGYDNVGPLVAFSGQVEKKNGLKFTEAQLNGISEKELPEAFAYTKADDPQAQARNQDEYRLLVVAEKYQTGFDQPLLCGMYVNKKLTGIHAVQTLSRLNRIHPLKSQDDVRILDFVNDANAIQNAFKDYFETTITDPGDDYNLLYDRERDVMEYGLLAASEMESFIRVLGEAGAERMSDAAERKLHARLHEYLKPAIDRFAALETDDEREGFRKALHGFVRAYSLIAQLVVGPGDRELERLHQYGRILLIRLPGRPGVSVDIGDADLTHFRLDHTGKHNLSLTSVGDQTVRGHAADRGGYREPDMKPLSEIITELNEQFGLDLGATDEVLVYQQVVGLVEDDDMTKIGLMNDEKRFGQVADDRLDDIVAENSERNTDFMKLYFDNTEFRNAIKEAARRRAYRIITAPARDEALARLRAEMNRETLH